MDIKQIKVELSKKKLDYTKAKELYLGAGLQKVKVFGGETPQAVNQLRVELQKIVDDYNLDQEAKKEADRLAKIEAEKLAQAEAERLAQAEAEKLAQLEKNPS